MLRLAPDADPQQIRARYRFLVQQLGASGHCRRKRKFLIKITGWTRRAPRRVYCSSTPLLTAASAGGCHGLFGLAERTYKPATSRRGHRTYLLAHLLVPGAFNAC